MKITCNIIAIKDFFKYTHDIHSKLFAFTFQVLHNDKTSCRQEANTCPKVVVADVDRDLFRKKQTVHVREVSYKHFVGKDLEVYTRVLC